MLADTAIRHTFTLLLYYITPLRHTLRQPRYVQQHKIYTPHIISLRYYMISAARWLISCRRRLFRRHITPPAIDAV